MRVLAECPLYPTESAEKVRKALRNLFPDAVLGEEGARVRAEAGDLEHLRELLQDQHIRDTARDQFIAGWAGNFLRFSLSKQAAFAGRVSFAASSPLGDITVTVEGEDLHVVIDHVAESTVGKRLSQDQPPHRRH